MVTSLENTQWTRLVLPKLAENRENLQKTQNSALNTIAVKMSNYWTSDSDSDDDDDDEIAYFTVRWKTRASFVYRTKNMKHRQRQRQ